MIINIEYLNNIWRIIINNTLTNIKILLFNNSNYLISNKLDKLFDKTQLDNINLILQLFNSIAMAINFCKSVLLYFMEYINFDTFENFFK